MPRSAFPRPIGPVLRFAVALFLAASLGACASTRQARQGPAAQRAALARALTDAESAIASDLENPEARRSYDAAVSRAVASWTALGGTTSGGGNLQCEHAGRSFTLATRPPARLLFDELLPVPQGKERELNRIIFRDGVGTPLVARWKYSDERRKTTPFLPESGYLLPVTATLDIRGSGPGRRDVLLRIHDPRDEETAVIAGRRHPLAADFSAVSEIILKMSKGKEKRLFMSGVRALRRSEEYIDKLGLLALEPPSRDRIPLVLVHGLMSRPLTWHNAFNELGADPAILKNYQVFFFRYPTGVPVIYSAARFRAELGKLHDELDRIGNHRAAHHMVLVGHSMGGLVSKLQVQDSGDRVWEFALGGKPAEVGLPQEEVANLRQYLEFKPNPSVDRVIFVCTPHRGSKLAEGFIGALGRRLVSLPGRVLGGTFDVLRGRAPQGSRAAQLLEKGVPSSIDNLSPKSIFVQESLKLPLKPGLHIHSIIGNKDGRPISDPKCSDGVVPYTSAHLDGVESEFVIRSNHSAHERSEAIAEMRRILLIHLKTLPVR